MTSTTTPDLNEEFHKEANKILKKRLKQFEYLTSITPSAHNGKKGLQWYINKRNRGRSATWQHLQDLEAGDVGFNDYVDWLNAQGTSNSDDGFGVGYKEPLQANPDKLDETQNVFGQAPVFSGIQIHTARKLISKAHLFLSPQEFLVFQMRFVEGLTATEIAGRMNINYKTVQTYISRLIPKLRSAYTREEN